MPVKAPIVFKTMLARLSNYHSVNQAEGERFELSVPLRGRQFSRLLQ
jgi:hypothetical protein